MKAAAPALTFLGLLAVLCLPVASAAPPAAAKAQAAAAVAEELVRRLPRSVGFDPELLGALLRSVVPVGEQTLDVEAVHARELEVLAAAARRDAPWHVHGADPAPRQAQGLATVVM